MKTRSKEVLIVIVTALPLEFEAVRRHLHNVTNEVGNHGTRYELGEFEDARVAIVETGAGNVDAAVEVETAIAHFDSHYLFFVGVAGGIKDAKMYPTAGHSGSV